MITAAVVASLGLGLWLCRIITDAGLGVFAVVTILCAFGGAKP